MNSTTIVDYTVVFGCFAIVIVTMAKIMRNHNTQEKDTQHKLNIFYNCADTLKH